jgi:hypothetical protein
MHDAHPSSNQIHVHAQSANHNPPGWAWPESWTLLTASLARTIHEGPNSPPFGFRLRPECRAFAQDSPGRRLEHRAERGVETGGIEKAGLPPARYETNAQRS